MAASSPVAPARAAVALVAIKAVHTIVWAFLAACVLAIGPLAWVGRFDAVAWLTGIIVGEGVVLGLNRGSCPLTGVAARFTTERRHNFDIYLPLWLAQYNKHIFGSLFVLGEVVALVCWLLRAA